MGFSHGTEVWKVWEAVWQVWQVWQGIDRPCYSCHKTAQEAGVPKLRLCGRCGIARYCGAECQKAHWKTHKVVCAAHKEGSEQPPTGHHHHHH
ncbi:hypothetical protein FOA52_009226 [Chlamydomonas sp. UWO 241]|nr:hypothetical protein FOA52_009226 [Chlamydomonas sp. UWO 241]